MGKKKGSAAAGVLVSVLIVASIAAIGYYQFEIAPSLSTSTSSVSTSLNIKTIMLNMTVGASTKTTDAYAPNPIRLVIGVNNSVEWFNGDLQGGVGVSHSATSRTTVAGKAVFDTGILSGGDTSQILVLTAVGTYDYYCVVHPTTMRGTIVVVSGK